MLAIFVFTYAYSFSALDRIESAVPELPMLMTVLFCLVTIGAFLYLFDYLARGLRALAVAARIAATGQEVIARHLPTRWTSTRAGSEIELVR